MIFYSFEDSILDKTPTGYYDLLTQSVIYTQDIDVEGTYTMTSEDEMRFDRVCERIYGVSDYTEELMKYNNILNSYSIKRGTIIKYPSPGDIKLMHAKKNNTSLQLGTALVNPKKATQKDSSRVESSQSVSPTDRVTGVQQITKDDTTKKITINNKI
jgi:hypothetical protein